MEGLLDCMRAERESGVLSGEEFTLCQQRLKQLVAKTQQFKTWLPLIERFVK
jgi:hypothetical protein